MDQPSPLPTRKVGSGALAGAVTVILVWVLSQFSVDIPAEVASSITLVGVFTTSYFVREPAPS